MSSDFKKIIEKLNLKIDDKLLKLALTHPSVTFENSCGENYERLEFLGDSVLKLLTSETLYKDFPKYDEGRMTKIRAILVSDNNLAKVGRSIGLEKYLILGESEEKDGGRQKDSVIACTFESILGAIYLSSGLDSAKKFLQEKFKDLHKNIDENLGYYNAKAVLQEYTQKEHKDLPEYKLIEQTGTANDTTFKFEVVYRGEVLAHGEGKTKKEAQQEAAKMACIKLGILDEVKICQK